MISSPRVERARPLRVGVIGFGAIGRPVVDALRLGRVDGAVLAGVVTRTVGVAPRQLDRAGALAAVSDLVVEVAGHRALHDHAVEIISTGTDLLTVSSGALADPVLRRQVEEAGPGRLWVCPGAIGGLDLIRTVRQSGRPFTVSLTSTKSPDAFSAASLDTAARRRLGLLTDREEMVVFRGRAQEAAIRFPANANVAATLALAAGDWEQVEVALIARAGPVLTHHQIKIDSAVGTYRVSLQNQPDPDNPATSGLVAWAVLRSLADRVGAGAIAFA